MNDYEIVKLFEKKAGIPSDTQAALRLGINRTHISNIRNGRADLSESLVKRMVQIAGEEIAEAWAARCKRRIMDNLGDNAGLTALKHGVDVLPDKAA